ncbi:hypothetical protein ACFQMM_16645 [Saliphagus sp. GCM10025308]
MASTAFRHRWSHSSGARAGPALQESVGFGQQVVGIGARFALAGRPRLAVVHRHLLGTLAHTVLEGRQRDSSFADTRSRCQ